MTRPNIFQTFVINPNQNQAIFVINPNQNQVVFVINPNQNLTTFVINPNHPPQKHAENGREFVIYYPYSAISLTYSPPVLGGVSEGRGG